MKDKIRLPSVRCQHCGRKLGEAKLTPGAAVSMYCRKCKRNSRIEFLTPESGRSLSMVGEHDPPTK